MLISNQHLLKSRVSTILGTLLLLSWTGGCCLVIWTVAHSENPLASAFTKVLPSQDILAQ